MIAQCSPIERPVRGSSLRGIAGTTWPGRIPVRAFSLPPVERWRLASSSVSRSPSLSAIGASEVVSAPQAMPESIWPSAILLAIRIVVSRPVPQACWTSKAGVSAASRVLSTLSLVRSRSRECLSTAPPATSPRRSPSRPKRSISPSRAAVSMSWLEAWA